MAAVPCKFFGLGICSSGDNCKDLHESPPSPPAGRARSSHQSAPSTKPAPSLDEQLKEWIFKIPRDALDVRRAQLLGRKGLATFFQQALKLVSSDEQTMQVVVSKLANDGGLYRIKELLCQDFESLSDQKLQVVWVRQLLPFLRLLSHESVLMSLVVEDRHAALINSLYGVDGTQAVNIFETAYRCRKSGCSVEKDVESCISVLAHLLKRNRLARVDPELKIAAEKILSLAESAHRSRSLERDLAAIRGALSIEVPDAEPRQIRKIVDVPTFTVAQDLPGELSEYGPRHDNDHADIQEIQILPTMEEIQSTRNEYLPRDDPSEWHIPGIAGLIDRHFRLVREDTVGQLRDAAKFELERLQNPLKPTATFKERPGARTHVYRKIHFETATHDDRDGILFVLGFEQPPAVLDASRQKREMWYQDFRRLQPDSLICLLSSDGDVTFLVVHSDAFALKKSSSKTTHQRYPLSGSGDVGYVIAQLTTLDGEAVSAFFKRCIATKSGKLEYCLLEFPGVLLPAFEHTLVALQQMAKSLEIPFADSLLPNSSAQSLPPAYSIAPGFKWDLLGLVGGSGQRFTGNEDAATVLQKSTLDAAQQKAVLHTLSNRFSLIQGPPGTGKSYTGIKIIETLLDNKKAGKLGPILVVCYTNHALDQMLEHLVDAGVPQIVRIGSRSKSERLMSINLRNITQKVDPTKTERKNRWMACRDLEEASKAIDDLLFKANSIAKGDHEAVIAFLKDQYPATYEDIFRETDMNGFRTVHHDKRVSPLDRWLQGGSDINPRTRTGELSKLDQLTNKDRRICYNNWRQKLFANTLESIEMQMDTFMGSKDILDSIRGEIDLRILSNANVIGITTTGLARSIRHLRKLNSKVLVVEEAAECLESQILTALLPSLEHAILIGDHQQLRPKIQNYELSVENPRTTISLDVSLFERIVSSENGVPFVTLESQRRMHPSISELIRTTLYPELQDAGPVKSYPEVMGMRHRLFWFDHRYAEDKQTDALSTSQTNSFEVDMVAALVRHIVRQGVYRSDDIAVLTPYLGQLRLLRSKLASSFEILLNERDVDDLEQDGEDGPEEVPKVVQGNLLQALRLATVDNFQGEEAKIVIISLVRSNEKQNCGFLRTSNRINVLLSRAQHGMYVIGNSETSEHIDMWGQVLDLLRANGNIGPSLELCCPRHPGKPIEISEPEDFANVSPEAGCDQLCGQPLLCGHKCPSFCHAESLHDAVKCLEPCQRPVKSCPSKHLCPEACGDECLEICMATVENIDIKLPCGHRVSQLPCWQYQDLSRVQCVEPVQRVVPGCGHTIDLPCHASVNDPAFKCPAKCNDPLPCGVHRCTRTCCVCHCLQDGVLTPVSGAHEFCLKFCDRARDDCEHPCQNLCHGSSACNPCRLDHGRSTLDDKIKKLVVSSNSTYTSLADRLINEQTNLLDSSAGASLPQGDVHLGGGYKFQNVLKGGRYNNILRVGKEIAMFFSQISKEEEFFQAAREKVDAMAQHDKNLDILQTTSDQVALHTRGRLLANVLLRRTELTIVTDVVSVWQKLPLVECFNTTLLVDLAGHRKSCDQLLAVAKESANVLQQAEALIFWAQFAAVECTTSYNGTDDMIANADKIKSGAHMSLDQAEAICSDYPTQTQSVAHEIAVVRQMLDESIASSKIAPMELPTLQTELSGTAQWHSCVKGHVFTAHECAGPVETSTCPQCDEDIKGQKGQAVNCTSALQDIEKAFGGLRI